MDYRVYEVLSFMDVINMWCTYFIVYVYLLIIYIYIYILFVCTIYILFILLCIRMYTFTPPTY